jgi:hypothetical protein
MLRRLALPVLTAAALAVLATACGPAASSGSASGPVASSAATAGATHAPATQASPAPATQASPAPATQASPATGSGSSTIGQSSSSRPNAEACHLLSVGQQNAVAGLPPGSVNRWFSASTTSSGMQLSDCSWSDSGNNQGAAVELACGSTVATATSLLSQAGRPFTVDGQTVTIYALSNGSVATLAAIGNPPGASITITPWTNVPQSVITQALTSGAGVVVQQGCH